MFYEYVFRADSNGYKASVSIPVSSRMQNMMNPWSKALDVKKAQ
jgi:hypothetical protein